MLSKKGFKNYIMKKFQTITLLTILFFLFSCKNEDKVNISKETSTTNKNPEIKSKYTPKTYLKKAKINSQTGLFLRKENNTKGEILTKLPFNTVVGIISFTDKFETIKGNKKYDHYGKWVQIEYQKENGVFISGYVFDDFLDYQLNIDKQISEVIKDTVTVTNEKEFVHALSSNRVILIDANEINLEKLVTEKIIDSSLIFEDTDNLSFDSEAYYMNSTYTSFFLHGYNNLSIIGKNKMVDIFIDQESGDVLSFDSCNNIFINNINLYHRVTVECGGVVAKFQNCSNFYIQNSHFDGSGSIGANIENSKNLTFSNCEFYNNNRFAVYIGNGTEISFDRCDFHDNSLDYSLFQFSTYDIKKANISLSNCYIKDNKTYYSIIEPDQGSEGSNRTLKLDINNCNISNNKVGKHIFNFQTTYNTDVLIANSVIEKNISLKNKTILTNSSYQNFNLTFNKTIISNNIDFYNFIDVDENKFNLEPFIKKNVYNTASDSTLTKFNTYKKDTLLMCSRNNIDLSYNRETKQLSSKEHLLNGLHRIKLTNTENNFWSFPFDINTSFVGEGNLVNGKLEGDWIIKPENGRRNKFHVSYVNGILNGNTKEFVLVKKNNQYNYITIIEGQYKEGKKHGVWKYYFKDGNQQKEIAYEEGKPVSPILYYFPNGKLREQRTDIENKNGETTSYYSNGEIESIITYIDKKIDISKSSFFDINGKKKKAIEVESDNIKNENGEIENFVDLTSNTYKNKVHIHYSKISNKLLGYVYYQNGIPYSVVKSFSNRNTYKYNNLSLKTEKSDLEVTYYNNSYDTSKNNVSFIFDNQNNLKYFSFLDDDNLISSHTYGGPYNLIVKLNQYKVENSKTIQHGISNIYSDYGLFLNNSSKFYVNGVPQKNN